MKRDSLSWRLASYYGPIDDWNKFEDIKTDVCSYARAVMVGVKNVLLILIALAVVSLFVGDFMAWVAASITLHDWIRPNEPAGLFIGAICLIGGTAFFIVCKEKFVPIIRDYVNRDKTTEDCKQHEPSVLALWYKGIKEKTCFTITIEKKVDQ